MPAYFPPPIECECGECRKCQHREYMRRLRANVRRLVQTPIKDASPVATGEGVFEVRSSWQMVEEAMYRMYGPPECSVLREMANRRWSEAGHRGRRYKITNLMRKASRAAMRKHRWEPIYI